MITEKHKYIAQLFIVMLFFAASCGFPDKEGTEETKPVTIDSMHIYLSTLDLRLPESAGAGLTYTLTVMKTMEESRRDSAFMLYRQFFYEVLMQQNQLLSENKNLTDALVDNKYNVEEVDVFKKLLNDNGMIMLQSEGIFYIDEKHNYLHDAFAPYVSAPVKQLLEIRKNEMQKGFSDDASLLISFDELGERVRSWEDLINNNPDFILVQEAMGYHNLYLSTFLAGTDNSMVFDFQTQTLRPEIKETYEDYIQKYSDRRSGRIISEYYTILQQNNWRKPGNLDEFLNKYKLESMTGVQPPTR